MRLMSGNDASDVIIQYTAKRLKSLSFHYAIASFTLVTVDTAHSLTNACITSVFDSSVSATNLYNQRTAQMSLQYHGM
jgi:hypothetical protein